MPQLDGVGDDGVGLVLREPAAATRPRAFPDCDRPRAPARFCARCTATRGATTRGGAPDARAGAGADADAAAGGQLGDVADGAASRKRRHEQRVPSASGSAEHARAMEDAEARTEKGLHRLRAVLARSGLLGPVDVRPAARRAKFENGSPSGRSGFGTLGLSPRRGGGGRA